MEDLTTFMGRNNKRRASNGLSGNLPESLSLLTKLYEFDVSDNSLVGQIPAVLGDCINLSTLYLQDNKLEGNVPAELGNLVNIQKMNLKLSDLVGEVPQGLCEVGAEEIQVDCAVTCTCCTDYEC